jgi:hypothetical protein
MLFWIDATQEHESPELFGLSLLERHIRIAKRICDQNATVEATIGQISELAPHLATELKRAAVPGHTSEIRVELREGAPTPDIGITLGSHISLRWSRRAKPLGERLKSAVEDAKGVPVICLSADTEIDGRLVIHLATRQDNRAFLSDEGDERCAAVRIRGDMPGFDESAGDLAPLVVDSMLERGGAQEVDLAEFKGYIAKIRRHNAPYLFKVTNEEVRDRIARFLFDSNYKGATDSMTSHV